MGRALIFLLVCSGCAPRHQPPEFVARIGARGQLGPLEPSLNSNDALYVKGLVFELFLAPADDGGWRSAVAERWQRTEDGGFRIRLREDLRFSDGSSVQIGDAIESFRAASIHAAEREGWIELSTNSGAEIETLLLRAVLFKRSGSGFVGTGPFRVEEQSPRRMRLTRVRAERHRIAAVELLSFGSGKEAFAALLKGEINTLLMPDPGQLELLTGVPRLQVVRAPGLHTVVAAFAPGRFAAQERLALAHGLPLAEIARAYGGDCEATSRRKPPPKLPPGKPFAIMTYDLDSAVTRAALGLRRALAERGGKIDVLDVPSLKQRIASGDFDLFVGPVLSWPRYIVPQPNSNSPADGVSVRSYAPAEFERLMKEDPPLIPICRRERTAVIDARIRNARLGPYDLLESLPTWEIAQ